MWDSVPIDSVSPNGTNIVACTGNENLALVLRDVDNISAFGAVTGASDSSLAVQSFIDDSRDSGLVGFNSGYIEPKQHLVLQAQVEIDKKSVIIDGNNSQLQLINSPGAEMFNVEDSSRCQFKNMVLLGDIDNPPASAFNFYSSSPAGVAGTNENITVENIIIGRRYLTDTTTGGSSDDTPQYKFSNGITVDGPVDGNNDEFTIRNVQVHSCTNLGIAFFNSQSIWSQIENCLANDCDIGFYIGCNMNIINPTFNRNGANDIRAIRQLDVRIENLQSENSDICLESDAGASFYVSGGKVLRNDDTPSYYVKINSGGNLIMKDLQLVNVQSATLDKIYHRSGSLAESQIYMRTCDINNAENRNMWDIDAGAFGALGQNIDIDVKGFKLQTSLPYLDREFDVGSINNDAGVTTAFGSSPVDLGQFYNIACEGDLQDQHLTPLITSSANLRFYISNLTGGAVNLGSFRYRALGLEDKIERKNTANVTPAFMNNGDGQEITVPLKGVRLGDFVAWAENTGWNNISVTAYVSNDNEVTVKIHNSSGGAILPPQTDLSVAQLERFGDIAVLPYSPVLIADDGSLSLQVLAPKAKLGQHVFVSYTEDLQGLIVTGNVSSNGVVSVSVSNKTGAGVTLLAGTFNVMTY